MPPPTQKLSYAPERWIHGAHYLRQNEQLYGEKKREGKGNKLFKHFFCSSNFIKEWSLKLWFYNAYILAAPNGVYVSN